MSINRTNQCFSSFPFSCWYPHLPNVELKKKGPVKKGSQGSMGGKQWQQFLPSLQVPPEGSRNDQVKAQRQSITIR